MKKTVAVVASLRISKKKTLRIDATKNRAETCQEVPVGGTRGKGLQTLERQVKLLNLVKTTTIRIFANWIHQGCMHTQPKMVGGGPGLASPPVGYLQIAPQASFMHHAVR